MEELKYKRWDKWDFRIEDPFGFYLRITEPDDWKHPKYLEKSKQVISETNLKV